MQKRLLITMRDMAAAAHLTQVIKAASTDSRFVLGIFAQDPASTYLTQNDIAHEKITLPAAQEMDDAAAAALLNKARAIQADFKPDVILCGLSTPMDGGLDEAVLATATAPTFLLQDFWGEQNQFFGRGAQKAFVLDEVAAARNLQRFDLESIISGSARHAAYKNTDWAAQRKTLRAQMGIKDNQRIIGFFGQALNHIPGYWRTVSAFIDTVGQMGPDILVTVRPHPRERQEDRAETLRYFTNAGVRVIDMPDAPLEDALPIYDVVCSLFSNCTFDASYQNWFATSPLSVPVSMLFDPEIADYYRQRVHFEKLPIHIHSLVIPVYKQDDLLGILQDAVTPQARETAWKAAKEKLPDPTKACSIILNTLAGAA